MTATDALARALADLRALAQSEAATGDVAYAAGLTEAIGRIEQAAEAADREAAGEMSTTPRDGDVVPTSAAADPVTAPANSRSTRYELYGPRRYPESGDER